MRVLVVAILLLLAGCSDNGHYQIAGVPSTEIVWRLDTRTGEIAKCTLAGTGRAICSTAP